MTTALIGHTGFVGSTLLRQCVPEATFNSATIDQIADRRFDLLICAGARAEKWRINQDPATDRSDLQRLITALTKVQAGHVILISTVDVYPEPRLVDEDTWIDPTHLAPYGAHRLSLEHFIASRFDTTIIRLPGLFGRGLKKNVIYDLLHENQVDWIHPDSSFQFYDLARLWTDVERARARGIRLLNVATEPIVVQRLAAQVFKHNFGSAPAGSPISYDFRSRYAAELGGGRGYLYDANTVLEDLQRFVQAERGVAV